MAKSFENTVNQVEVSLAIEQLLIADYGTPWTPGRVDVGAPPNGFYSLGAVVEDQTSVTMNREMFNLKTGIPMVTQFQSIMSIEGKLSAQLHSNSWRKLQYALGNYTAVATMTLVSTVATVNSSSQFTFTGTTAIQSLAVGMQVAIAANAAGWQSPSCDETRVTSFAITQAGSSCTIYVNPPLTAVSTTWVVGTYPYVRQIMGGSSIKYYTLLGVADFIDGVQVVHYFPKVAPSSEMTESFKPSENGRIPLSYDALGVSTQVGSCTELEVFERFYFPSVRSC